MTTEEVGSSILFKMCVTCDSKTYGLTDTGIIWKYVNDYPRSSWERLNTPGVVHTIWFAHNQQETVFVGSGLCAQTKDGRLWTHREGFEFSV